MYADAIVLAGHIETLTGTTAGPSANAVAIADGRIVAVGDITDLGPVHGPGTVVHAFPGATILPGLTDVHAHPVWGSIEIGGGVDLGGASTLDQVFTRLADAADRRPADVWITGFDLDVNVFEGHPAGTVFAERFPGRPISLMSRDAHALVVSPRVVELAGLTGRETFTDASSIEVGPDGRPTGFVVELQAMGLVFAHYPDVPVETAAGYVRHQLDRLARGGLTGLHALDFTDPSEAVYRHIEEHGELPLRVRCSPLVPADSAPEVWQEIADLQGRRGRRWHVEGAKFMLDGTADNGTAWFDRPDIHGENREPLWRDTDAYRAGMRFFTERGVPTATHAIGDQAVRFALDVIEEVGPVARAPHRIEHIESLPDDLLDRFAELDVVASLQPVHGTRHTHADATDNWSRRIGPDRVARGWRTRDLLDHGAVVALGSDWPIGPGDPRIGLADCQLRRPVEEPETAPVQPGQAISAREAYTGMTASAAYAAGASDDLGKIAPGHLADLTVFAANPLDLTPDAQPGNPVLATVVGGTVQLHTNSAEGNS
ncbi:amidohydrolase [Streptomyces lancefieldiae]|uniref:Amidohydrolase family protein n=1 Tax=Streptomyces lancefieldiae TaxID=3075520 RepID=A0ABU3ALN7_9ACTN|nr:amidohydrolase family protein [Streptomyces sp. DSM 40712]MDT0611110.1 amidohydrolase family protein [Streptomyces sp. DSM 40712]